jgi:hypothetical protein
MVEWLDSAQPLPAWRFLDDLPPLEAVRCFSVGWLVAENKRVKVLVPNIGDVESGGSAQGSGFIRIPVASIVRQVRLAEDD